MSNDSFTEVTHQSWFSRIGSAIAGVLFGFILFLIAFPLLFWNEGRAVQRYKTLKEGSGAVVSLTSDSVDASNDGKLIHTTGKADTDEMLSDPVFNVSMNALKLKRVVEMYQWKEKSRSKKEKKVGGGETTKTTYSYSKTWSDKPINSSKFKKPEGHENPGSIPYESRELIAEKVTLGEYQLSASLVEQIKNFKSLPIKGDAPLPQAIQDSAKIHDASYYIASNPSSPQVGDTRIKFKVVKPTEVSVVAKQVGSTLGRYTTTVGGTIELLQTGVHSADAMFQKAHESNKMLTWILRAVGYFMMFAGLALIFRPLSVLADIVPIFGTIVGAGTGLIAFLLSTMLSLLTIAIAWIVFRPLLGIALVVVVVGLTLAIFGKLKSAKAAQIAA